MSKLALLMSIILTTSAFTLTLLKVEIEKGVLLILFFLLMLLSGIGFYFLKLKKMPKKETYIIKRKRELLDLDDKKFKEALHIILNLDDEKKREELLKLYREVEYLRIDNKKTQT